MSITFILVTLLFVVVSVAMILIILVQRPQGGGLAGAFGGTGGGGTESVFGGRVGDALTWATVVAFIVYLGVAISLNLMDDRPVALTEPTPIGAAATPEREPQTGQVPAGATGRTADGEPIRIERTEPPPGILADPAEAPPQEPAEEGAPFEIIPPGALDDEAPADPAPQADEPEVDPDQ